ncbi:MAG: hypothetical protein WCH44_13935 [Betaproteobacteria bacterium]
MTAAWKIALDKMLIHSEAEVWTTGSLWSDALLQTKPPSRPTFERWISEAVQAGKLKKVRAGIFVNAAGNSSVSPAAAAGFIRRSAIPSLSWVLEQNWILNNFGDVITCTVPMAPGLQVPNLSAVKTPYGTYQFRALPWRLQELDALPVADWRDDRYAHPRATPEKAFCDWLYLGQSPRSSLRSAPFDLDYDKFNKARLKRIVGAMGIKETYENWLEKKQHYDQDPEVRENTSLRTTNRPA